MDGGLHDSVIGTGPDVVLLHGLFGMGSNLGALARSLESRYRVHMVDLPCHGRSPGPDSLSLGVMAERIVDWMDARHIARAHWVGHSLGGKVAMQLALQSPSLVDHLVVADIAPVRYEPGHERVFAAIRAVSGAGCRTRQDARAVLREHLEEEAVVQFLLLSLAGSGEAALAWRFDAAVLEASYPALLGAPEGVEPFTGPALFLRGELSDYVDERGEVAIASHFPEAEIATLKDCGHWLHAEDPRRFNAAVGAFLDA